MVWMRSRHARFRGEHRNSRWSFRINAPGRRPDSQSIWKPVATTEYESAVVGEVFDGTHYGRVGGDGTASEVVAV